MAKCDYCGSTIIFGGKRDNNGRFCNQQCRSRGGLIALSRQLPEAAVQEQVWKMHQGSCPKCQGRGPVDVHVSHKIWSAVVLTRWTTTPQICCRRCGMKAQVAGAVFSAVLGWWGIPWGVLITPVQVGRNLLGIMRPPESSRPSAQLENILRMAMATNATRQQPAQAAAVRA